MFDEERIYERFMKNKLISKDGFLSKDDGFISKDDGFISKDGLMTDDCKSMTGDCKLMTDDKIINSSYFGVSNLPISLQIPSYFTKEFLQFNAYQRKIILYSLNLPSKFYLIHGLPGTGKSKCIRFIVKLLTNYSKKVLVMTYTNRSLDLLKGIDNAVYINCFNYTELTEYKFDYLVVDEATQMHFPFCLVGLDMCDKIVLFGDDKQLAPICKDRRLGISIFELVKIYLILNQNQSKKKDSKKIKVKEECEKIEIFEKISFDSFSDFDLSDENISNNNTPLLLTDYLKITYRMSIKITALANILFYNNKLISHSKHIGEINYFDTTDLSKLLLLKSELVILCFYNDTVSYVKSLYNLSDKQVSTIDRYQGSECENVILFVDRMSELCRSRERVNVAVTRSKKLFYLVGDRKVISECEVLSELIEVIERIKDD